MSDLVLGTAGHIDHGKTALVRALTGTDTDRLAEEKRRGITIDLGFAELRLDHGIHYAVIDVPGHEAFIRNMLAGATGIDVMMLVVAADEGVMPQTREHIAIMDLLGVHSGVVAITKTDLVDSAWLDLVREDVVTQLAGTPFDGAPIVPVSTVSGTGLAELRRVLTQLATTPRRRDAHDLLRIPVDRVFSVHGTGTVVTGTIWTGTVASDQTVRVLPAERSARVRGVQIHGRAAETARCGQRVALALAGVARHELSRGDVVVSDPRWSPTSMLTCRLRMVSDTQWTVRPRQRVRVHLGTAEVMARTILLERERLEAGDEGWAQLRLERPLIARAGDHLILRSYSPITTIAGGRVVEADAPKRRRLDETQRTLFSLLLDAPPAEALAALADDAGWSGLRVERLPFRLRCNPPEADTALALAIDRGLVRIGDRLFARPIVDQACQRVLQALDTFHARAPLRAAAPREDLRRALPPGAPRELAEHVLTAAIADGTIRVLEDGISRAGYQPRLTDSQQAALARLRSLLLEADLTPPTATELPADLRDRADLPDLLALLERTGDAVRIAPDITISAAALERAAHRLVHRLGGRKALGPADFREVFEVSRKYLIPLLEHMDRSGLTHRDGDRRDVAAAAP
ncbi:MAG: selenocysteine-specific translation elongation factor [Longimicrobiales bacterium]